MHLHHRDGFFFSNKIKINKAIFYDHHMIRFVLRISGPRVGYPHTWLMIVWASIPSPSMYSKPFLLLRP